LAEQEAARDCWSTLDNFVDYARQMPFMASRILSFSPRSVLEFGCNAARNLAAIRERNPAVFVSEVHVNDHVATPGE
jgi:hypothetical protein